MHSFLFLSFIFLHLPLRAASAACRNTPGDLGFPSQTDWAALNASVSGRLVPVIPSAKYCEINKCTEAQWHSANFRINNIPGAMNQVNWEQDYDSNPPSLCLRNGTTCEQGNVPFYAVLVESAADIQNGVKFAQAHNLRLAVKASGHDLLGRSTAQSSLLIHTHKLQNIEFTDNFIVSGKNKGTAITVGSGVNLSQMYNATGARGKIFVGGTAPTVVAAGGYVQGGGHSALGPLLGMASDNCLEFNVVVADGRLLKVNDAENSDLFWAMRGGGAGSWGVIVNATFQTFPTFNATGSLITITTTDIALMGKVVTAHAEHIFDWDSLRAGQYYSVSNVPGIGQSMEVTTFFPIGSVTDATNALQPFVDDVQSFGANVTVLPAASFLVNELAGSDGFVGGNVVFGSRLIPASTYRNLVAGGKVSENANMDSAVIPQWRSAKSHVVIGSGWNETTPISEIRAAETKFRDVQASIFNKIAGANIGSYSNEADVLERDFQHVFYGPNYARLSVVKRKYDPKDLFIVGAGVGSERWDRLGLCKV